MSERVKKMAPLASGPNLLDDTQADLSKATKAVQRHTANTTNKLTSSRGAVSESKVGSGGRGGGGGEQQVRRHSRHNSISIASGDRTQSSGCSIDCERKSEQDQVEATKLEGTQIRSKSQSANNNKRIQLRRLAGAVNCCCCYENCLECAKSIGRSIDKMNRLKTLLGPSVSSKPEMTTMKSDIKHCGQQEEASDNVSELRSCERFGQDNNNDQTNSSSSPDECLKCCLIARWTASQANLVVRERPTGEPQDDKTHDQEHELRCHQQTSSCSDSERLGDHDCQLTISSPGSSSAASSADCRRKQALDERSRQRRHLRRRTIAATESSEPSAETSSQPEVSRSAPKTPAPRPPGPFDQRQLTIEQNNDHKSNARTSATKRLLSEAEVHSIEHSLKSHKSSLYVCGCLANLYFTKTHLAEGGRSSRASNDEWKLNQTGVPVLIFDSGLTKNRSKKRLSISLVERGSAFVLWSDTIDYLSGYRAYNARLHSTETAALTAIELNRREQRTLEAGNCDTFHVMYLSSNHRIMVGLSFDDPICARLFLAQIELVAADPSNIALTGPKMRKRQPTHNKKTLPLAEQASSTTSGAVTELLQRDHTSGWSTLKRVAWRQFGTRTRSSPLSSVFREPKSSTAPTAAASEDAAEAQFILTVFKPRPLPQLAATGKLWSSSGKLHNKRPMSSNPVGRLKFNLKLSSRGRSRWPLGRQSSRRALPLPRKCDISAPCLFQHVTSVDLEALNELYSGSYLLTKTPALPTAIVSDYKTGATSIQVTSKHQSTDQISDHSQVDAHLAAKPVDIDRSDVEREQPPTKAVKSLSLSSSSSCYSSASISPASSECGATSTSASQQEQRPAQHNKQSSQMRPVGRQAGPTAKLTRPRGYVPAPRPPVAPPKPPQRGASWSPQQAEAQREGDMSETSEVKISLLRTTRPSGARPMALEGGARGRGRSNENGNKIGAIIQELQAGASGELVEAKRRLMADIAGQVRLVARNRQEQQHQQRRRQESAHAVKSKADRRHPSSSFKGAIDIGAGRTGAVSHL